MIGVLGNNLTTATHLMQEYVIRPSLISTGSLYIDSRRSIRIFVQGFL